MIFGRPHPVRLEEEAAFQGAGRDHLEIIGVVGVGGSVEHPAGGLHQPEMLQFGQRFAALEHQVLEQVGEAGATLRFGTETDVVMDRDADHSGAAVRRQQHPQAVVEAESFDRIVRSGDAPGRALCADLGSDGVHCLTLTAAFAGASATRLAFPHQVNPGRAAHRRGSAVDAAMGEQLVVQAVRQAGGEREDQIDRRRTLPGAHGATGTAGASADQSA